MFKIPDQGRGREIGIGSEDDGLMQVQGNAEGGPDGAEINSVPRAAAGEIGPPDSTWAAGEATIGGRGSFQGCTPNQDREPARRRQALRGTMRDVGHLPDCVAPSSGVMPTAVRVGMCETELNARMATSPQNQQCEHGARFWIPPLTRNDRRERTRSEVEFISKALRLEPGSTVHDGPCGGGRHAIELAAGGHAVTGVDFSSEFLGAARKAAATRNVNVTWLQREMRELEQIGPFDGALCFGNSFGYLDDAGNAEFLAAVARVLKPGARLVIESHMVPNRSCLRFGSATGRSRRGRVRIACTPSANWSSCSLKPASRIEWRRTDR